MNKYISKFVLMSAFAIAGTMGTTSCTDYLDKAPETEYEATDPYKNFTNFQGFVESLWYRIANTIPALITEKMNTGNRKKPACNH